jgi:small subunit ribosomal protein S7
MSKEKSAIKLFDRWSFEGIKINDWTLENYINLRPIIVPHSAGRHEHRRFWKSSKVTIIERFVNRLLAPGFMSSKIKGHKSSYNSGKKMKLLKCIENAFTVIEVSTDQNPIQILVDAICNSAPREEVTRISMGGISYASAVDISPQRRIDMAIKYLVQGIAGRAHTSEREFELSIVQELVQAAQNSQESRAIKRKDELERIAVSAR